VVGDDYSGEPVAVLLVTMPEGTLAEDAEVRTRERYAVISVLGTEYVPADEGRLGFVCLPEPESGLSVPNWSLPIALAIIFGLQGLYVVACALILRRAAQQARDASLARLRERAWYLCGSSAPEALLQGAKVRAAIERIGAMSGGAFAPITQHPLVGAILVPSGSFGLMGVLETWYGLR